MFSKVQKMLTIKQDTIDDKRSDIVVSVVLGAIGIVGLGIMEAILPMVGKEEQPENPIGFQPED